MEAYKFLLEEVKIEVPAVYKPYVKPELLEFVSGETSKLKITIKNITEETFPGGTIERWVITTYGPAVSLGYVETKLTKEELAGMKIPKLNPGMVHQIEYDIVSRIAGVTEVLLKIASYDSAHKA